MQPRLPLWVPASQRPTESRAGTAVSWEGMIGRRNWLRNLLRENERQEDLLSLVFDERWGEIDDLHRT